MRTMERIELEDEASDYVENVIRNSQILDMKEYQSFSEFVKEGREALTSLSGSRTVRPEIGDLIESEKSETEPSYSILAPKRVTFVEQSGSKEERPWLCEDVASQAEENKIEVFNDIFASHAKGLPFRKTSNHGALGVRDDRRMSEMSRMSCSFMMTSEPHIFVGTKTLEPEDEKTEDYLNSMIYECERSLKMEASPNGGMARPINIAPRRRIVSINVDRDGVMDSRLGSERRQEVDPRLLEELRRFLMLNPKILSEAPNTEPHDFQPEPCEDEDLDKGRTLGRRNFIDQTKTTFFNFRLGLMKKVAEEQNLAIEEPSAKVVSSKSPSMKVNDEVRSFLQIHSGEELLFKTKFLSPVKVDSDGNNEILASVLGSKLLSYQPGPLSSRPLSIFSDNEEPSGCKLLKSRKSRVKDFDFLDIRPSLNDIPRKAEVAQVHGIRSVLKPRNRSVIGKCDFPSSSSRIIKPKQVRAASFFEENELPREYISGPVMMPLRFECRLKRNPDSEPSRKPEPEGFRELSIAVSPVPEAISQTVEKSHPDDASPSSFNAKNEQLAFPVVKQETNHSKQDKKLLDQHQRKQSSSFTFGLTQPGKLAFEQGRQSANHLQVLSSPRKLDEVIIYKQKLAEKMNSILAQAESSTFNRRRAASALDSIVSNMVSFQFLIFLADVEDKDRFARKIQRVFRKFLFRQINKKIQEQNDLFLMMRSSLQEKRLNRSNAPSK